MSVTETNFEDIAITRDLVRKPEIRVLAIALAEMNAPTGSVVDRSDIPAIYARLAYRLLTHPEHKQLLIHLLKSL